jgi:hypothetical protein
MKPARLFLYVVALLVSGFPLDPARLQADELPEDTNKIESLTPEQANRLATDFKGLVLQLEGLTTLDAETAKALAEFKGDLSLDGLTTLSPEAAKALAEFKSSGLSLNGLTTLHADTAKTLAEFKGDELCLDGLTTLHAATAKAIAEFKGEWLYLNGLTTLDADTAEALAGFKGKVALSDHVKKTFFAKNPLTPETALAWAVVSRGNLSHVTTLDADTVKVLAEFKGNNLSLDGLTTLETPDSIAIAQALATRKGRLSLPNLKKISPKTLTALIEKQDVEIPYIETLELIQEPDGSGNDDFVIPKWLEEQEAERRERQKQQRAAQE